MADCGLRAESCKGEKCPACELCGAIEKLSLCGACRQSWYCSKEHQKSHWRHHKKACKTKKEASKGQTVQTTTAAANGLPAAADTESKTRSTTEEAGGVGGCQSAEETALLKGEGGNHGSEAFDQVTSAAARAHGDRSDSAAITHDANGMSLHHNNNNPLAYQDISQFLAAGLDEAEDSSVFWQASSIRPEYFTSDALTGQLDELAANADLLEATSDPQNPGAVTEMTIGQFSQQPGCDSSDTPSQRQESDSDSTVPKRPSPKQTKTKTKKEPIEKTPPEKKEETKLVDYVTKCLKDYGMCVVDNFLGAEKGDKILQEVVDLSEAGQFQDGQISSATLPHTQMQKVRGDKITWVEKGTQDCNYIGYLIERLDRLMKASNGRLGSREINGRTKAMVACYPGDGTGYMQHVDNPNQDGRCITCIYYLNKDWDVSKHGGLLRIQPSQLPSIAVADIEPKFDRLLFFWSDRRNPHEVQPAFRRRYAITVWYFDAEERRQARKRHEIIDALAKAKKKAVASSSSASRPTED